MKILHIVSDVGQNSGGPARSVPGLVSALESIGVESHLTAFIVGDSSLPSSLPHFHIPPQSGFFAWQRFLSALICKIKPDLIHLNGLWDISLHIAATTARHHHVPYIIAPRGMLQPWPLSQKAFAKKIVRLLWQNHDLHLAAALHVTADSERNQMHSLGFSNFLIQSPNGVNVPTSLPPPSSPSFPKKRALFLSRMSPHKGVLELVNAWAAIRPANWVCELVYTTNTIESRLYEKSVLSRIRELSLSDSFILTGALSDSEKWNAYRRANLFVLPTHSENFGIVIAEALYAGLPTITTKGAPWAELVSYHCGKWINTGVPPLIQAFQEIFALPDNDLLAMGSRGHDLICKKYLWPAIASQMHSAYQQILSQSHGKLL